jgi:hypothetical protein
MKRVIIPWSKCRPLKRSCVEAGSVIQAATAGSRAFKFAPEPRILSVSASKQTHGCSGKSAGGTRVSRSLAKERCFGTEESALQFHSDLMATIRAGCQLLYLAGSIKVLATTPLSPRMVRSS